MSSLPPFPRPLLPPPPPKPWPMWLLMFFLVFYGLLAWVLLGIGAAITLAALL
jgi:hypothetical protein